VLEVVHEAQAEIARWSSHLDLLSRAVEETPAMTVTNGRTLADSPDWARGRMPPLALTVLRVGRFASATCRGQRGSRRPWRPSACQYLAGIMNAVLEPGVKKVALMKSHQSALQALNNILRPTHRATRRRPCC
jgi:hypothetical protein